MNSSLYSHAFVLNATPVRGRTVILDERRGRIDVFARAIYGAGSQGRAQPLATGCLIEWAGREDRDNTYITSSEFIAAPALRIHDDIFFIHHICELCCAYLPLAQGAHDVYPLLLMLYNKCPQENMRFFKKIFLYNLISLLGLQPIDTDPAFDFFLFPLISCVGNSMFDFQDIRHNNHFEKKLTVWLYKALDQAHMQSPLKTFSFINHLGIAL